MRCASSSRRTNLSPQKRAELERNLSELQSAQVVMDALAKGDWDALKNLETNEHGEAGDRGGEVERAESATSRAARTSTSAGRRCRSGWSAARRS